MPLYRIASDKLIGFLGVNLRRDPVALADGEMARCVNSDLQTQPGVLRVRQGLVRQNVNSFGQAIQAIGRHNAKLYAIAGQEWYRDGASILATIPPAKIATMATYQTENSATIQAYLATETGMYKDDGTTVTQWGVDAPRSAPDVVAGGAGNLTGDYRAGYTYARIVGGNLLLESNMSPQSSQVTLASNELDIDVEASLDPQVTHIRLYRTLERGAFFFFDRSVANTTATVSSSKADTALGALIESGHNPPVNGGWVTEFQGALWVCRNTANPDQLWYSSRFQVEYFPPENYLKIGNPSDPLQCAIPQVGFLGVFSRETKYRVFGNHSSGFSYLEALNTRGTPAPQATLATSRGTLFWSRDGIWATNFVSQDEELSVAWQPLFYGQRINDYAPLDWTAVESFGLAEYKRRLYASYTDIDARHLVAVYAQETGQWYHYEQPVRALYYDEFFDQLLIGGHDGVIYIAETGVDDDGASITQETTLATRSGGDRFVRKQFEYIRFDITVYAATMCRIFIDGVELYRLQLTGIRTKELLRLPSALLGYTWEVRLSGRYDLYAVTMLYAPLEEA